MLYSYEELPTGLDFVGAVEVNIEFDYNIKKRRLTNFTVEDLIDEYIFYFKVTYKSLI